MTAIKIGLSVIGVVLCALGVIIENRSMENVGLFLTMFSLFLAFLR